MSLATELIQNAVVHSNRWFPFSRLNRVPYAVALRLVRRQCSADPAITGLYLRNSLATGDWTPGLSDIDVALTFDARLSAASEFQALRRFWSGFGQTRRFFPMLGDVLPLVSGGWFDGWSRLSIWGYEVPHWRTLAGPPACGAHPGDCESVARDAINEAFTRYLEYFVPWSLAERTRARDRMMTRLASRITRYLAMASPLPECCDSGDLVATLARRFDFALGGDGSGVPALWQDGAGRAFWGTPRMLEFLVRHHNPFLWAQWRAIPSMAGAVAGIEPPTSSAIVARLKDRAGCSLPMIRQEMVVGQQNPEWFSGDGLRSLVDRLLMLRLALDRQMVFVDIGAGAAEARRTYLTEDREHRAIRDASVAGTPAADLRFAAFHLLRSISAEVLSLLESEPLLNGKNYIRIPV